MSVGSSIITFEEFKAFHAKHGYCLGAFSREKQDWNERELRTRYERYIRSKVRTTMNQKKKKEEERQIPDPPEPKKCTLISLLEQDPFMRDSLSCLYRKGGWLIDQIDRAHVFGKGANPSLKYDVDDIIWLNRYSHNNLDQFRHPVTGEQITAEEVEQHWRFLVGDERYDRLESKSRRKDNV